MTSPNDAQQYIGRTAVDLEGHKIEKIGQVYLDDRDGEPLWVTVSTGLFGNRESFAPVAGSAFDGDNVRLAVSKDTIKDAPNVDNDEHISGGSQRRAPGADGPHPGQAPAGVPAGLPPRRTAIGTVPPGPCSRSPRETPGASGNCRRGSICCTARSARRSASL